MSSSTPPLRLGTRRSELALFQAKEVADRLAFHASVTCELVRITTSGERFAEAKLSEIGGKNVFVKEIEEALTAGTIDLAVHSSKDLPAVLPDGFAIAAVLEREDPRDAIVLPEGEGGEPAPFDVVKAQLSKAPRIGTSSLRRAAQLACLLPGAEFLPVRGNLGTRLRKLDEGQFDALVLAAAGLYRLQHNARISAFIPVDRCVPAPGQGIIAVEVRADDEETRQAVAVVNEPESAAALDAERALVEHLGGGCQMPIGAYAELDGDRLQLTAVVASPDGRRTTCATTIGTRGAPREVGETAANELLAMGAGEILAAVKATRWESAPS